MYKRVKSEDKKQKGGNRRMKGKDSLRREQKVGKNKKQGELVP